MSTTILIPTDFNLDSIESLRSLLLFQKERGLKVILIHGLLPSKSIYDLLFQDRKKLKLEIAGEAFVKEINSLKEELKHQVDSIDIVFYSGAPQSSFNCFLEANQVDRIVIPSVQFDWSGKRSFNILPYLDRAKIQKQVISWEKDTVTSSISSMLIV